jgi:hypothetical protein
MKMQSRCCEAGVEQEVEDVTGYVSRFCKKCGEPCDVDFIKEEFDIDKIRKEVCQLVSILCWYQRRGGLLPYDWNENGHPIVVRLADLAKVDISDGRLRKQDKRGAWR